MKNFLKMTIKAKQSLDWLYEVYFTGYYRNTKFISFLNMETAVYG